MDKDNLTTLIAQGDRKAFEHFYKKEYKKAVFYTNLYLSDYELSKDIAQDAFVAIWVNKESLDTDYPIQPYLYSIIRNKAINLLKRLSVDSKVKNELLKREYKANLAAIDDSSAESIIAFQLKDCISKAFSELPDKISNTFIESRIKGMSYKEIADKNNLSVKVVEYHISQALKLFREKLKDFIMLLL